MKCPNCGTVFEKGKRFITDRAKLIRSHKYHSGKAYEFEVKHDKTNELRYLRKARHHRGVAAQKETEIMELDI